MRARRQSPSGPLLGLQNTVESLDWDPAVTPTLALELLPAGHPAGLYLVGRSLVQLAASTTGQVQQALSWKPPRIAAQAPSPPQSIQGTDPGSTRLTMKWLLSATTTGGLAPTFPSVTLVSDGSEPIILRTDTSGGVVVTFDVYAFIMLIK